MGSSPTRLDADLPLHCVTTTAALQALLVRSDGRVALFDAKLSPRVALHFKIEQDAVKQATMPFTAIAMSDGTTKTVILHLKASLSDALVRSVLTELLHDKSIVKVTHRLDSIVPWLIKYGLDPQVKLVKCACLQLAYIQWLGSQGNFTITRIVKECGDAVSTLGLDASRVAHDNHCANVPGAWSKSKLVIPLLQFLKHHVLLYLALYDVMSKKTRAVGSTKVTGIPSEVATLQQIKQALSSSDLAPPAPAVASTPTPAPGVATKVPPQVLYPATFGKGKEPAMTENTVLYVNTTVILQKLVPPSGFNLFDAKTTPLVALHFHEPAPPSAKPVITLAGGDKYIVLHLTESLCKGELLRSVLSALVKDASIAKVVLNIDQTREWLHDCGVTISPQEQFTALTDFFQQSVGRGDVHGKKTLLQIATRCGAFVDTAYQDALAKQLQKGPQSWAQPIFSKPLVLYLYHETQLIFDCYSILIAKQKALERTQETASHSSSLADSTTSSSSSAHEITYVNRTKDLSNLVASHGAALFNRTDSPMVALHLRSAKDPTASPSTIVTMGDGATKTIVLHVTASLSKELVHTVLETLLKTTTVKVLFNVDEVFSWLRSYGVNVALAVHCVDLQAVFNEQVIATNGILPEITITRIAQHCNVTLDIAMHHEAAVKHLQKDPLAWTRTNLAKKMLQYLGAHANSYLKCYKRLLETESKVASSSINRDAGPIESTSERHSSSSNEVTQKPVTPPATIAGIGARTASVLENPNTYVKTTADFQKLILSRGTACLFDPKTASVVALHFHVSHDDDDDDGKNSPATDQGMVVTMTSCHRVNDDNRGDCSDEDSDDLVDDSSGGSAGLDATGANTTKTDTVVLHLLPSLSQQLVCAVLTLILQNPAIVKVVHNIHHAAFWLHRYGLVEVRPVNCVDLQLAYEHAVDATTRDADLAQIAEHCGVPVEKTSYRDTLLEKDPLASSRDQLPKKRLQALVHSNLAALACYVNLAASATGALRKKTIRGAVVGMTCRRWRNAIVNQGVAAIWFDSANDYLARSVECLEEELIKTEDENGEPTAMTTFANNDLIPKLQLQCELEPLLSLLPEKYRAPILAIDGFHDRLVDICLDVGRFPHVYVGKGQRVPLGDGEVVSKADIDEVLEKLGGEHKIGFDNRAGIDRQLHRISVMRSKTGEIYGLTMRVGRALAHAANLLTDVLMSAAHRDKSILLLGRPGSGKTTLIRDIARSISETQENVCIIDTSNEIGGDGLVPHECVGWARRMMVPSLEQQASVMIECVQNHTVETLIIDEIGRKAEVNAAGTVRQRGPRLIASGHGDFRSLIRNQDLKGLIGGVQQVTVGDAAMQKSANKSKLQTERAGAPIFDIIVELDHVDRGRCQLIWDVGAAVDSVLSGHGYRFEVRKQAFGAHGILSL
ncbi:hypothetical protein FI667_g14701, partial [Globisporangium splendens]